MKYTCAWAWAIAAAALLTGCNKDEVITDDSAMKPVIVLDSEDGVYTVKVGHELTISPEYANSPVAYSWDMDGVVVGTAPEYTAAWPETGEYYLTVSARNSYGTSSEDIRVDVLELTPPVISLALPEGGLEIMAGEDYTFAPDIQHSDGDDFKIVWYVDGKAVADTREFTFNRSEAGDYVIAAEASNADGTDRKEFTVKVLSQGLAGRVIFTGSSLEYPSTTRYTFAGRPVVLMPVVTGFRKPQYSWTVDGAAQGGDTPGFTLTPDHAGEFLVTVTVREAGTSVKRITRNLSRTGYSASTQVKVVCVDATEKERMRQATASSSPWQSEVFEYTPAPGQFIDDAGAIATSEAAADWAKGRMEKHNYVSLGAWGGYVIVGFDHSIPASDDYNFAVMGNAFNAEEGSSNEPGTVWVMQDVNGNGRPDDQWYQLKGCKYSSAKTLHNTWVTYYRPASTGMNISWTNASGEQGQVTFLSDFYAPGRRYWPVWISVSSYTLYGSMIPARNSYDPATGFWSNLPYEWGYADNAGTDAIAPATVGLSSGQLAGMKIADAVAADGSKVALQYVDFVMVQTAVQAQNGPLGEISTEVLGVCDLSIH